MAQYSCFKNAIQSISLVLCLSLPSTLLFAQPTTDPVLKQDLMDELCKPDGYFQECFTITPAQCRAQMSKSIDLCLQENKLNLTTIFQENDSEMNHVFGKCIGVDFIKAHMSRLNKNKASCQKEE